VKAAPYTAVRQADADGQEPVHASLGQLPSA